MFWRWPTPERACAWRCAILSIQRCAREPRLRWRACCAAAGRLPACLHRSSPARMLILSILAFFAAIFLLAAITVAVAWMGFVKQSGEAEDAAQDTPSGSAE